MGIFNKNKEVSTEQEIADLEKAAKRSRRIRIGFGIACICLLGLLATSLIAFGLGAAIGPAFYAVNLTLTLSALGCALGAGIAHIINRKNRTKIKALRDAKISGTHEYKKRALDDRAIQKSKRRLTKTFDKDKARRKGHLSDIQREYIKQLANEGLDKAHLSGNNSQENQEENQEESKFDWREKETLSIAEAQEALLGYKVKNGEKVKDKYETSLLDAKIERIVLYPTENVEKYVTIKNVAEFDNDVCYNMARKDMMQLLNKTEGVSGVKIVTNVNGEKGVTQKTLEDGRFFSDDEIKEVTNSIPKPKEEERTL